MNRFKKFIASPKVSLTAFVLAVVLLLFSSVGGARAALTYYSETYASRVQMYNIGVTLLENGNKVSWRDYNSAADGTWNEATGTLLANMIPEGEQFKIGKKYQEELSVQNSGSINQFVRVTLYRYWLDKDGNKMRDLSPNLMNLNLVNLDTDWLVDTEASTTERTVLYYNKVLNIGMTTPNFTDSLMIDNMVATKVTQTSETKNGYTTITTVYDYDGVSFCVDAKVDAVQEHNAEDAIWSAWGRRVKINNGVLSLN